MGESKSQIEYLGFKAYKGLRSGLVYLGVSLIFQDFSIFLTFLKLIDLNENYYHVAPPLPPPLSEPTNCNFQQRGVTKGLKNNHLVVGRGFQEFMVVRQFLNNFVSFSTCIGPLIGSRFISNAGRHRN